MPEVLLYVTDPQLSVATGAIACAAVIPDASLHSTEISSALAKVVHVGTVVSSIVITCVLVDVFPQISCTVYTLLTKVGQVPDLESA